MPPYSRHWETFHTNFFFFWKIWYRFQNRCSFSNLAILYLLEICPWFWALRQSFPWRSRLCNTKWIMFLRYEAQNCELADPWALRSVWEARRRRRVSHSSSLGCTEKFGKLRRGTPPRSPIISEIFFPSVSRKRSRDDLILAKKSKKPITTQRRFRSNNKKKSEIAQKKSYRERRRLVGACRFSVLISTWRNFSAEQFCLWLGFFAVVPAIIRSCCLSFKSSVSNEFNVEIME